MAKYKQTWPNMTSPVLSYTNLDKHGLNWSHLALPVINCLTCRNKA